MDRGAAAGLSMEAPSLSYLLAHPTAIGIGVAHPRVLFLLAAAALFFLWPHPAGRRASALRAGALACVVLALAGVRLTARLPTDRLTVAAIDRPDNRARIVGGTPRQRAARSARAGDDRRLTFAGDSGSAGRSAANDRAPPRRAPARTSAAASQAPLRCCRATVSGACS
jgi:hypothetical protein